MRGITPVIALVMLMLITVGMVGISYAWFSGLFSSQTSAAFSIVYADKNSVIVRNDGTQQIGSFVTVVIDGSSANIGKKIKVLSIYPGSCYVQTIANNDGAGLMTVDCITVGNFNAGSYDLSKYDVVIFDANDCWSYAIDTEEKTALRSFVQNGGGFVATHDTTCCGCGAPGTPALSGIQDILGYGCGYGDAGMSTIARTRQGDITSFPYVTPASMSVLSTHSECGGGRPLYATRWYELTADDQGDDAYLTTYQYGTGKTAKLAWGHTSVAPAAGSDESKLIANTIYAVSRDIATQKAMSFKIMTPLSVGKHSIRICTNSMCAERAVDVLS